MLLVQKQLKDGIEILDSLSEKYGINNKTEDGMTILDYDQIKSSSFKELEIVRDCRGLVLDSNFDIVACSFRRFFNLNENYDTEIFDWDGFTTTIKEDGSLIRVSYYKNKIRVFTRNSFGKMIINDVVNKTWEELVLEQLNTLQKATIKAYPRHTFVFELTSPYNQVVKFHDRTKLVMLALFDNTTGEEVSPKDNFYKWCKVNFDWVKEYDFNCLFEIECQLDKLEETKSTDEGFVIKDRNGIRLKLKQSHYLLLHRLNNNGNINSVKALLPVVLKGEEDEVVTYFPHLIPVVEQIKKLIEKDLLTITEVYDKVKDIEDQKTFAIELMKTGIPYFGLFFWLKKNENLTLENLKELYRDSEELVLKVFNKRGEL